MLTVSRIFYPEPIATWTQETLNRTKRRLDLLQRIGSCFNIITGTFCYLSGFNACRNLVGALSQMHVPTFIMPLSLSFAAMGASLAVALMMKRITERRTPKALGCNEDTQKAFANSGCDALTEELSGLTGGQNSLKWLCEKVNRKNPGAVRFNPKSCHLQTYLQGVDFEKIIRLLNVSRDSDVLIEFMDLRDIALAHNISLQFANASVEAPTTQVDRVNMQLKALFSSVEQEGARRVSRDWSIFRQVRPTVYLWENRSVVVDPPAMFENAPIDKGYQTVAKILNNKISYTGIEHLSCERRPSFQHFVKEFKSGHLRG
jgi:hypothetical protein